MLRSYASVSKCWIPLCGFKNLRSLQVYNFYGKYALLVEDLVNVLVTSPGLKVLGLGMQDVKDYGDLPAETLHLGFHAEFLEKLCVDYGSRDGTSPLRLDTLRLGHVLFLDRRILLDKPNHMFLDKLVHLDGLRSFHVYNGSNHYNRIHDDLWRVDWSQLKHCKSLQQLSVTRFNKYVRVWMNDYGSTIADLIVTDWYGSYAPDLDNFDLLENVHLSMLFIQTKFGTRSELEGMIYRDVHPRWPYARDDAEAITILDRLPDGGAHLTRLGLCLDFATHWVC